VTQRLRFDLDAHSQAFIERQIRDGHYRSTSEVVCAGLCLLEARDAKLAALRRALIEGEQSGPAESFDLQSFLESAKRRSRSSGGPK
jgi:antitoxin ParD1/3/4